LLSLSNPSVLEYRTQHRKQL